MVPPSLYRECRCGPRPVKAWAIEFGTGDDAGKGRLTALPEQAAGSRPHNPKMNNESIVISWAHAGDIAERFPLNDAVNVFTGVEVTDGGIVFDMPVQSQPAKKK